ncbi:sushi, von Willebrand factor type A, EGF and pentraxin domain-containing protein 1-like [Xyrauchen texanus]|uniref:sushi, von Willebrand factor type A, EGF and pentraxin domain-containing protein 1-like n=1 Tax=Xyrauchen texanus TaxID=154827 RepID=UPI0022420BC7|nr:sushi, von Willebrand factor type A, EGF and pentraxin domain-containing protein 1-like [Xyrauchen texanus]
MEDVVTCPDIYVGNGEVAPQAVVFDTVVQITCAPGFKLNGAQQVSCGADGSWMPNVPTCEPVTCPDIYVANGQVAPQVVVFNTVVQITCSPGFNLNGAQQLRCGADGSWTSNVPTCEPVTCPAIFVSNGEVAPQAVVFNTVVQITCAPGFILNGAQQLRCGADGSWTSNVPTCEPVTCPDIYITNGQVAPQAVVFNTVVQITCSPGFSLNGAQQLRCGADGSWTSNVPTCEPDCVEPEDSPQMQLDDGRSKSEFKKGQDDGRSKSEFKKGQDDGRSKSEFKKGQNDGRSKSEFKKGQDGGCSKSEFKKGQDGGHSKSEFKKGQDDGRSKSEFKKGQDGGCSKSEFKKGQDGGRSKSEFKKGQDVDFKCDPGYTLAKGSKICHMVKCPAIFVANGQVSTQAVVFNTVVQITCAPGFNLNGAPQVRCGADGFWTPNIPNCEPVKCPVVVVANGVVAPQAVSFKAVVQIFCDRGFVLNGAQLIRCGADGSWMPNIPTCEPVTCPDIYVANGEVAPQAVVFNTVVQITCSPGFNLNGAQQLRCGADGSWTSNVPTCEPVTCPDIYVANGQVAPQAVVFNTVVQITCSPGFNLNGAQQLRCGADGSWTPNVPTCEPVTCPDIYVANGQVAPQGVVFDTVVQITCSPGFSLNGAQQLRCGADGSWTPNVPTCEPDCVEAEDSPQMQLDDGRSKSVFNKGQDVDFKCDPGYTLAKGSKICHMVKCPAISVANGQVSTQAVVFNTVVQITCAPGFKLNGGQKLRCGADGSWMPNVPTCKPVKCPSIVITNGRVSPQTVVFNAVVQITCAPGFKLNGAQQVRCGADGFWMPNIPTCEPVKCPVVVVASGVVAPQAVSFKAVVQIFCDRGFVLNGAQLIRCGADGFWTPNIPTCEPVTCPDIYVANGEVAPQAVVFDTVVQITCSPGFNLNGAQQLRCGADGSWTSNVPTCEPVTCPDIYVANGQVAPQAVVFDTVVQITCSPGFNLNGAQQLRCGADGSWTPNVPTCEPVTCPDIYVANGEVAPQAVVFDTVVQITCSPGFNLNGAQQLLCGADGSWTPNVPTCEPVTCPDIYVANGEVAPQAVVFNTVVQITCSPGFKLNGAQQLRCGADGSWTSNVPTCEPVFQSPESMTCSAPVVENGVIKGGAKPSYEPNDTVSIICKAGCRMIGASVAKCGPDGQWQGLPRCRFTAKFP